MKNWIPKAPDQKRSRKGPLKLSDSYIYPVGLRQIKSIQL
jgi:hypothetical protein